MAVVGLERGKVLIVLTEDAWRQLEEGRDTATGAKAGQSE